MKQKNKNKKINKLVEKKNSRLNVQILKRCKTLIGMNFPIFVNFQDSF